MTDNILADLQAGLLPDEAHKRLLEMHEDDLKSKIKSLGLAPDRQRLLRDIIRGEREVDVYVKADILRYVFKKWFPEDYYALNLGNHVYSSGELYEYDPPKNGENMMKHGFSFSEVVSYWGNSGAHIVPCPDGSGGTRHVMFTKVDTEASGKRLDFPMPAVDGEVLVISIGLMIGLKFRFISAHSFSLKNCKKDLQRAIKNVYADDREARDKFISECENALRERFSDAATPKN